MRRLFSALVFLCAFPLMALAQEPTQHPIDKALDACIDKNGSTAGMVECTDQAYAAWDKELNRNYVEVMRTVKPKQKEALRLSQLEWIKHRDTFQGTMYIPMRIGARLDVIKQRAQALKSHLDVYQDAAP